MAEKHTDEKLYRVVRKDGSHLNTKVNPDGTKSALQFTDDNNDLNGPVDLLEVDEEELIRTEYISVPQAFSSDMRFKYDFFYKQYSELYCKLYAIIIQSEYVRHFIQITDGKVITFGFDNHHARDHRH